VSCFAVLTESKIVEIFDGIDSGRFRTVKEIAEYYSVHNNTIYCILNGRTWKCVTNKYPIKELKAKVSKYCR